MSRILYFFLLTPIFLNSLNVNAQYKLQETFSNLPTFSYPVEMIHADDGTNRLFVAEQQGLIYVFNDSPSVNIRHVFIDLSSLVTQSGGEMGLLGLTFHPNYESNRYFYVNFTFDSAFSLWSRISRFTASASNPDTALIDTELILLTLNQPYPNHNGGKVAFGLDGYLYISFGDGGSGNDPENRAQNRAELLGKILRINVDSASVGRPYSIPSTNPFYGNTLGYKEEIYSYGLRNMWKFNFDYPTNTIWGSDVGQGLSEEIDLIENGKNYGWRCYEGNLPYITSGCSTASAYTFPIWEYPHDTSGGFSITGGYVYRGALLPALYGKYIYADYVVGRIWALTYDGINPATNELLIDSTYFISSFGLDQNNEIYVCEHSPNARLYRIYNPNVITLNLKVSIEALYNVVLNRLNISDTIRVFLHSAASPNTIVDSANTVVDSLSLSGLAFFNNAQSGTYYIRVKHRNGLETWSKAGGETLVRGNIVNYDFTSSSSQAYGNNEILKDGLYHIYSGDVNLDGIIDASDLSLIDNDVFNLVTGYVPTDLTGDYFVDASDLSNADNNIGIIKITPI